jgi:heparan-alpha-glucosaminide N-acetyltransferase
MLQLPKRLLSVDVFRAVTMVLMIFVNDLWSDKAVPRWLEHAARMEDALDFSDIIFPAFLFIVGLSIPLAISARVARGATKNDILTYIITRSLALLVMGFFHVNLENYDRAGAFMPKSYWQILITVAFFLIWLDYSPKMEKNKKHFWQGTGILILVVMAFFYRGLRQGHPIWMRPQWWGILGLIGWAYLLCAVIYFFSKNKISVLFTALVFFLSFDTAYNAGWLDFLKPVGHYVWIVGNGSMPALTMAGVLVSCLHKKFYEENKQAKIWSVFSMVALLMLAAGFAVRPYLGGISKIRATPSWVMICTCINIFAFMFFMYLVDIKQKQNWFSIVKPAGTSTLTAYLLPYIHYAIYNLFYPAIVLPLFLRAGFAGIIKSFLYALIIVVITGLLERKRIRLKI